MNYSTQCHVKIMQLSYIKTYRHCSHYFFCQNIQYKSLVLYVLKKKLSLYVFKCIRENCLNGRRPKNEDIINCSQKIGAHLHFKNIPMTSNFNEMILKFCLLYKFMKQ